MKVKDQIRDRMEKLGITVAQLAGQLGVAQQTVRHWLNGRSFPGKKMLPLLEPILGVPIYFTEVSATSNAPLTSNDELTVGLDKLSPEFRAHIIALVYALVRDGELQSMRLAEPRQG